MWCRVRDEGSQWEALKYACINRLHFSSRRPQPVAAAEEAEVKECSGSMWSLHFDDVKYEGRAFLHVQVENHLEVSVGVRPCRVVARGRMVWLGRPSQIPARGGCSMLLRVCSCAAGITAH